MEELLKPLPTVTQERITKLPTTAQSREQHQSTGSMYNTHCEWRCGEHLTCTLALICKQWGESNIIKLKQRLRSSHSGLGSHPCQNAAERNKCRQLPIAVHQKYEIIIQNGSYGVKVGTHKQSQGMATYFQPVTVTGILSFTPATCAKASAVMSCYSVAGTMITLVATML